MDSFCDGVPPMAGDWIKMRVDLYDNNKVWLLSANLGLDEFSVIGRLHRIWSWADKNTKDGTLRATEAMIDRLADKEGFAKALMDVGWLKVEGENTTFPNFDRHNGDSAKKRATEAERKRTERLCPQKTGQDADKTRTDGGQKADKSRTKRGPEKRRGEESTEETKGEESPLTPSCSEPQAASEPPAVFPVFETVGRADDPKRWELTEEHVKELGEAYPAVDVWAEARRAWQWVKDKPQNRKTFRGMAEFLHRWMRKEQDRGGGRQLAFPSRVAESLDDRLLVAHRALRESR
jgi:hypothetical protein